ncbi:immunoglobulin-like domain-containing protein [Enterococcus hulanensis]|uniref:immunoglobulin-like domain-containing protein n=1 Tax=Enterococcus hulanensis TaxID=2559929 RepID=UPI0010F94C8C|nr:immunoglobulin-like domain-containing protein [Enterococcus hulanensis]
MTENGQKKPFTEKQKKIAAAAVIGTLVLGGGGLALTNRNKPSSIDSHNGSKVSRVPESGKKENKSGGSKKKYSSDTADDVFSTYDIDLPETKSSSDYDNSNSLSPSEIKTMANTLGGSNKNNTAPAIVPTMVDSPTSNGKNSNSSKVDNDSGSQLPIETPKNPIVIVPEEPIITPPVVEPPAVITTTPVVSLLQSSVVTQEGQPFDPNNYFTVKDTGDSNPAITYSKTELTVGRNEILITATNKYGNKGTATLVVYVNKAPVLTANESTVEVSIHTSPDLRSFVTANDLEDGDITDQVIISDAPDMHTEGSYTVRYNVTDSQGGIASAVTVNVVVTNEAPVIHASDKEISIGEDSINLLEGITVTDMEDDRDGFPISISTENILDGEVDLTTEGEYVITVGNVKDRDGKAAADVQFTVKVTNSAPVVSVPDLDLKGGETFNKDTYKNTIVVSDKEDDRLGLVPVLEVSQEDLDGVSTDQVGEFTISIKATDSMGKSTEIKGVIRVTEP